MNKIEEIASVHLGRAGDGSVVKPYVTPDRVDPSLLVAIPRQLNRDHYGINKDTLMEGYDTWNAYEVSF
jgi:NADPH-dependent 7-cyano-7-deazaguanine reductase QueF-like protein